MKKIYLISALVAILCGVLVFGYIRTTESKIAELSDGNKPETVKLVVAKEDIAPFTPITAEMVTLKSFPKEYAHESAATSIDQVINAQANGTIVKGEIVLLSAIGSLDEIGQSLSYEIPDGKRAMTISVDGSAGVGGYVAKGDYVDVMVFIGTSQRGDEDKVYSTDGSSREISGGVSKIVADGALVLRAGNKIYADDGKSIYSSLTLALDPAECEKLYAAMNQGSIYVTLRQINDNSKGDGSTYSLTTLMGN